MVCLKAVVLSLLLNYLLHDFGIDAATTSADLCHKKEDGYTIVNTKDCSQFYVCINESPFLANCPAASFYNPQIGKCDSEASSDACVTLNKGDICCDQEHGSIIPYPNDKYKYVICQYPLPEIVQCPQNTIFDSRSKTCREIGGKPNCSKLPYNSKWVYVGDCRKYYVCEGIPQKPVVYICYKDQLYHPSQDKCVPPNQYECPW